MSTPKIGYLSAGDPLNKKTWSGSHYSIYSHLQKHVGHVVALGPCRPRLPLFIGKCLNQLSVKLFGKRYNYRHSALLSKAYGRYFTRRILEEKPDVIIAVSASCELARVRTQLPVIYVCDAIVHSSLNYYKTLTKLHPVSTKESLATETLALQKSGVVAFAASWAREIALREAGKYIRRSVVIPFGPNFDAPPAEEVLYDVAVGPCTLLFVGVFWETKGGPVARECLEWLIQLGIDARLVICGCEPPDHERHPRMEIVGFLDKDLEAQAQKLKELYQKSHFFILPTQFEAYGVVFCEASAYGLPSLGTKTGGVPDIIRDGRNGFLFEKNERGRAYAEKIKHVLDDPGRYSELRRSTRAEFEDRLNWESWAIQIKKEIDALTGG